VVNFLIDVSGECSLWVIVEMSVLFFLCECWCEIVLCMFIIMVSIGVRCLGWW